MRQLFAENRWQFWGKSDEAIAIMERAEVLHEPELLFYYARH
jgi:hypothetical protein